MIFIYIHHFFISGPHAKLETSNIGSETNPYVLGIVVHQEPSSILKIKAQQFNRMTGPSKFIAHSAIRPKYVWLHILFSYPDSTGSRTNCSSIMQNIMEHRDLYIQCVLKEKMYVPAVRQ